MPDTDGAAGVDRAAELHPGAVSGAAYVGIVVAPLLNACMEIQGKYALEEAGGTRHVHGDAASTGNRLDSVYVQD